MLFLRDRGGSDLLGGLVRRMTGHATCLICDYVRSGALVGKAVIRDLIDSLLLVTQACFSFAFPTKTFCKLQDSNVSIATKKAKS